ncbi:outer membrane protein [Legionella cardiaca]|uniref:Porin family protein n=1 Tax=Legionella cardiaca TaxID=1071983 RepID=A0ABY8AQ97_9GAMM|nr:outer membrane beta-barrel protein [Legionella cardiaca]WED42873.1 porin family protein [Legionella cardiaca]
MMSKTKLQIVVLGCLLSMKVFAGNMGWDEGGGSLVVTLSAGPAWVTGLENETVFLQPGFANTYTMDDGDSTLGIAELFVGWNSVSNSSFQGQLGVAVAGTSQLELEGSVWQNANPNLNNFNYSFNVRHLSLAAKAKILGDFGYSFYPYVSGSLGYGYNRATDFSLSPVTSTTAPAFVFSNNSTGTFTYTAGAGIDISINEGWRIGLGYEFADWGAVELGLAPIQISPLASALEINHIYTQQFLVSISYLS